MSSFSKFTCPYHSPRGSDISPGRSLAYGDSKIQKPSIVCLLLQNLSLPAPGAFMARSGSGIYIISALIPLTETQSGGSTYGQARLSGFSLPKPREKLQDWQAPSATRHQRLIPASKLIHCPYSLVSGIMWVYFAVSSEPKRQVSESAKWRTKRCWVQRAVNPGKIPPTTSQDLPIWDISGID